MLNSTYTNNAAQRMLYLRKLSGISRKAFEDKFKFPTLTIKKWENVGIIEEIGELNSLEQYLNIYNHLLSVKVNIDWILRGIGEMPTASLSYNLTVNSTINMLESNKSFFFFINQQLEVEYVNEQYSYLLSSYPSSNILGQPLKKVIGEAKFALYSPKLSFALLGEKTQFPFISDFSSKNIVINSQPGVNSENKVFGVFNFIENISNA